MNTTSSLTMVLTDNHARKCGGCTLCCKLLPMSPDLYPPERVAEVVDRMIDAGWARASDFAGMVDEWTKPAGKPCQHQRHGKGCAIYERRPFCCRNWSCRWLTGDDTANLSRPDRSRYVIDLVPDFVTLQPHDASEPTNIEVVQIWVDSKTPDAWRDPALMAYIERRAAEGKAAIIRFDSTRAIVVFAPAMSQDGQWHEVLKGERRPQHVGADLIAGLMSARKVKVG
jgi:Putative zinc- or iron-chelating domain